MLFAEVGVVAVEPFMRDPKVAGGNNPMLSIELATSVESSNDDVEDELFWLDEKDIREEPALPLSLLIGDDAILGLVTE